MNLSKVSIHPDKWAKEILSEGRKYICQQFNIFMDAIYNLHSKADCTLEEPMTTDGIYLYYNPTTLSALRIERFEKCGFLHDAPFCTLCSRASANTQRCGVS